MRLLSTILVGAVLAALFCAGCGDDPPDDSAKYRGPKNTCQSNNGCPPGTVCDSDILRCVVRDVADGRTYMLKVIPPSAPAIPAQFFEVVLDANGDVTKEIEILKPVTITLSIPCEDGGTKCEDDPRIIINDLGASIPGQQNQPFVYKATGGLRIFSVSLLPGIKRYQIKIIPEGAEADDYPPRYYDDVTVTTYSRMENERGQTLKSLSLVKATRTVRGSIKRGSQAVDGVTVVALDSKRGRSISTVGITGCSAPSEPGSICGEFAIGLPPGDDVFSLRISRPREPWYPAVITENYTFDAGVADPPEIDPDKLDIRLDPLDTPVKYFAHVEKTASASNAESNADAGVSERAPGCIAIFESEDVAGGGRVALRTFTDQSGALVNADGEAGVLLFPASYRVTIFPPSPFPSATHDHQVLHWDSPLDISGAPIIKGQVFTLSSRPRVHGLITAAGIGVPSAGLSANTLPGAAPHLRTSHSTSDHNGAFSIWTDRGTYRLTAEAPSESGFAWGSAEFNSNGITRHDVELPFPFVARARLSAENLSLDDTTIEWYEKKQDRYYLVGRSTTSSKGNSTALLPP